MNGFPFWKKRNQGIYDVMSGLTGFSGLKRIALTIQSIVFTLVNCRLNGFWMLRQLIKNTWKSLLMQKLQKNKFAEEILKSTILLVNLL